ncbi:MAG TPA: hypothetical protein VFA76_03720 [Terriglobales bacterium]|nr:hypothetical protein [Terriglobales bacterium]
MKAPVLREDTMLVLAKQIKTLFNHGGDLCRRELCRKYYDRLSFGMGNYPDIPLVEH